MGCFNLFGSFKGWKNEWKRNREAENLAKKVEKFKRSDEMVALVTSVKNSESEKEGLEKRLKELNVDQDSNTETEDDTSGY